MILPPSSLTLKIDTRSKRFVVIEKIAQSIHLASSRVSSFLVFFAIFAFISYMNLICWINLFIGERLSAKKYYHFLDSSCRLKVCHIWYYFVFVNEIFYFPFEICMVQFITICSQFFLCKFFRVEDILGTYYVCRYVKVWDESARRYMVTNISRKTLHYAKSVNYNTSYWKFHYRLLCPPRSDGAVWKASLSRELLDVIYGRLGHIFPFQKLIT